MRIHKIPAGAPENTYDRVPEYSSHLYLTNYYNSPDKDRELMAERLSEPIMSIMEWAKAWKTKEGRRTPITSTMDALTWIRERMKGSMDSALFEFRYFDKYNPNEGIEVFVEGFHNAPTSLPLITICSFNPPGSYYCMAPRNTESVFSFSAVDFTSPQKSMRYGDELKILKGISPYESWQLIFEIKSVNIERGAVKISDCGWSAISIFTKFNDGDYVNTGIYMVDFFLNVASGISNANSKASIGNGKRISEFHKSYYAFKRTS